MIRKEIKDLKQKKAPKKFKQKTMRYFYHSGRTERELEYNFIQAHYNEPNGGYSRYYCERYMSCYSKYSALIQKFSVSWYGYSKYLRQLIAIYSLQNKRFVREQKVEKVEEPQKAELEKRHKSFPKFAYKPESCESAFQQILYY